MAAGSLLGCQLVTNLQIYLPEIAQVAVLDWTLFVMVPQSF
jgi:hypothetical protein